MVRLTVGLAGFVLCQCSSPLRTALENDTGQDVALVVEVRKGPPIQTQLGSGQTLSVKSRIGSMSRSAYAYGLKRCEFRDDQIERLVDGDLYGKPKIVLRPCVESSTGDDHS